MAAIIGSSRHAIRQILGPSSPILSSTVGLPTSSASSFSSESSVSPGETDPFESLLIQHKRRILPRFLYLYLAIWIAGFVLFTRQQWYSNSAVELVTCTESLWNDWPPDVCGVGGASCQNALVETRRVRCLGGCENVKLGNPRWVGDVEINQRPLIIGGGDANLTYRADSWVCASAIHASLISPSFGGCVQVSPISFPAGFTDFIGSTTGLSSLSFSPHFPGAFRLSALSLPGCIDLHYPVLAYNTVFLFLLLLLFRPPPFVHFSILILLGWFQLVLFSDIPHWPPSWQSIAAGLLPVLLVGYWIYKISFKDTIKGFQERPFQMAFWQSAGFWIGIESSTVFARLPISRLGYDALDAAGILSLVVIVAVVLVVVVIQAWEMRKVGMLQYYLVRYLPLVPVLVALASIPGYVLRVHHYMLALLALPVLSLPNRISLCGQAFFLGLFIDGIGRWGWASIIETSASLRGDAASGSLVPAFLANSTENMLFWTPLSLSLAESGIFSFSLLLDDIKIGNPTISNFDLTNLSNLTEHFFRIAYVANGATLDFTEPIRWLNGTWEGLKGH